MTEWQEGYVEGFHDALNRVLSSIDDNEQFIPKDVYEIITDSITEIREDV